MKKHSRILCSFIAVLVVIAMLPLGGFGATNDYSEAFANITLENVKAYDNPLPKKGVKQSVSQIKKELKKIKFKVPGKGPVIEHRVMSYYKSKGAIVYVYKHSRWDNVSSTNKRTFTSSYQEVEFMSTYVGDSYTLWYLFMVAGNDFTWYAWEKGVDTGVYVIGNNSSDYGVPANNAHTFHGGNLPACKKYKDAKVLGEKCFVYSCKYKYSNTYYYYVSRKTGQTIKSVIVHPSGDISTSYVFSWKYTNKDASFFNLPEGIPFKEYDPDTAISKGKGFRP